MGKKSVKYWTLGREIVVFTLIYAEILKVCAKTVFYPFLSSQIAFRSFTIIGNIFMEESHFLACTTGEQGGTLSFHYVTPFGLYIFIGGHHCIPGVDSSNDPDRKMADGLGGTIRPSYACGGI